VLLGRSALERVYVDVSHRYLLGRPRRKKKKAGKKRSKPRRAGH
jgi:uncharacterized C2H2 Zn-finger protein